MRIPFDIEPYPGKPKILFVRYVASTRTRNLYPHEIAQALSRAMSDDILVDEAAKRNLEVVRRRADRSKIGPRVVEYYKALAKEQRQKSNLVYEGC